MSYLASIHALHPGCDKLRRFFHFLFSGVIRMKLRMSALLALFLSASSITLAHNPLRPVQLAWTISSV